MVCRSYKSYTSSDLSLLSEQHLLHVKCLWSCNLSTLTASKLIEALSLICLLSSSLLTSCVFCQWEGLRDAAGYLGEKIFDI